MRVALLADVFPPQRSSGAVQLRDLSAEFAKAGHQICVMVAASDIDEPFQLQELNGVQVLRLKTLQTRDVNYIQRTLAELSMPIFMLINLWKSPIWKNRWDIVIWYSPTIFLGLLAYLLKKINKCKSYLIIRDIFPEWAVDMGLIKKNSLPHLFFKIFAEIQYLCADIIGIQSEGNRKYFKRWASRPNKKLKILDNWLAPIISKPSSIEIRNTKLNGRFIFVYAGNMGVAQGLESIVSSLSQLQFRQDIGFIFIGRGSEATRFSKRIAELDNALFFDEIDPYEIPNFFTQCHAGIVSLDVKHNSHNIPGKFITYMQAGLPVLAKVNIDNDLIKLVNDRNLGICYSSDELYNFKNAVVQLINLVDEDLKISYRCKDVFEEKYTSISAMSNIIKATTALKIKEKM